MRQEVQRATIRLQWQETKKMIADGLTKALSKALFQRFTEMIGLEDQEARLDLIRREDELRERLEELRTGEVDKQFVVAHARDLGTHI